MAKHILRLEEFEIVGEWYCAATNEIGKIGNEWYILPFALQISSLEFVELLINKFHPDNIKLLEGPYGSVLSYSWNKQADMRKYKNWINAELRKKQFYVE